MPSETPLHVLDLQEPTNLSHSLGSTVAAFLTRFAWPVLALAMALVCCLALAAGSHKPLWFDEMFTLIVATQPSWHRFMQAMIAEGNPPLNALLAQLSLHLFGMEAYALRLPATLGFCTALAALFCFVRRERGALSGLLAVVLLAGQPVWKYAFEARPYGLMLALVMLALVCWQSAVHSQHRDPDRSRLLAFAGLFLAIVGAIFSHYIGVLNVGVPLLFGEGYRSYRRRTLDWPLLTTAGCGLLSFAWIVPMMHRTESVIIGRSLWDVPAIFSHFSIYWQGLQASWNLVFSTGPLVLLVFIIALTWTSSGSSGFRIPSDASSVVDGQADPTSAYALAAALGAAFVIPAAWLAMLSAKGYFFCRYGIASSLGVAMLGSLLVARNSCWRKQQLVLTLVFFTFLAAKNFQADLSSRPILPDVQFWAAFHARGNLPVVIANPLITPSVWWYAPVAQKNRLVYLSGIASGHPEYGQNILDADLTAEKDLFPAKIYAADDFVQTHSSFLLFDSTPNLLTKSALEKRGCVATTSPGSQNDSLYSVKCPD